MRNIIFLAPPAAGKGTQSEMLMRAFGYNHLSTGDLLREEISKKTPLGEIVEEILSKGELVSDEIAIEITKNKLIDLKDELFILDGFPRTLFQAEELKRILDEIKIDNYIAIYLESDIEFAMQSALGRMICGNCNKTYNKYFDLLKPKVSDICDDCGCKLTHRSDDNEETFKARYQTFLDNSKPILDFYDSLGLLRVIDNKGTPDEIFKRIEGVIK